MQLESSVAENLFIFNEIGVGGPQKLVFEKKEAI
jgi:hypothetical protein